jgi:hypothetical protein
MLDRRSFVTGAGLAVGGLAIGWPAANVLAAPDASVEWAADHIFGTYPPYAHPIPYGRQSVAPPVSIDLGAFDPFLMI